MEYYLFLRMKYYLFLRMENYLFLRRIINQVGHEDVVGIGHVFLGISVIVHRANQGVHYVVTSILNAGIGAVVNQRSKCLDAMYRRGEMVG